jgi:hypothetical protein
VTPSFAGHIDPQCAYRLRQHPTCVRLMSIQRTSRANVHDEALLGST